MINSMELCERELADHAIVASERCCATGLRADVAIGDIRPYRFHRRHSNRPSRYALLLPMPAGPFDDYQEQSSDLWQDTRNQSFRIA